MKFSRYVKKASQKFNKYLDVAVAEHLEDIYEYIESFKIDYFDDDPISCKLLDSVCEMTRETEFYNPREGDTLDTDTLKDMLRTAVNVHINEDYESSESPDTFNWDDVEAEYKAASSRIIEVL